MTLPGASRYERLPTRMKIQMAWTAMFIAAFAYQFHKMATNRVHPKREEALFMHVHKVYGDNPPPELLEMAKRQREAVDAWTLSNMLRTPTPGEVSGALQNELDPRNIQGLKSWNGY
eukprot:CAMPEP_0176433436 /NCGR_PEP_ID=MMETSP0127-20121128/16021_1 /TAXON_ID=938130 /ORGANISM="Platyophrya macrostoma, Strain WH" /LENGTH=116 /DNA_ID=CAMNT_0017815863 /DNA_START=37 /DNA_END=387 /DNA_ORIENTATION=-